MGADPSWNPSTLSLVQRFLSVAVCDISWLDQIVSLLTPRAGLALSTLMSTCTAGRGGGPRLWAVYLAWHSLAFLFKSVAVVSLKALWFYLKKSATFIKVLFFLHQKEEMVSRSCDTELEWLSAWRSAQISSDSCSKLQVGVLCTLDQSVRLRTTKKDFVLRLGIQQTQTLPLLIRAPPHFINKDAATGVTVVYKQSSFSQCEWMSHQSIQDSHFRGLVLGVSLSEQSCFVLFFMLLSIIELEGLCQGAEYHKKSEICWLGSVSN